MSAPVAARIVFTGGGTAGHVLPALAVAESLVKAGHARTLIEFVGSRRGMGSELIAEAGFSQRLLPGRGVVRRFSLKNVLAIGEIGVSYLRCLARLIHVRPGVVIAFGGYGAIACSLAAATLRVPLLVMNVDVVPGLANRLLARVARQSAVAAATAQLPRQVITGVPLRESVLAALRSTEARSRARFDLGISESARLLVVAGGSLGAWRLNQAALGLAKAFSGASNAGHAKENDTRSEADSSKDSARDVVVYHVTGARDYTRVLHMADTLGLKPAANGSYRVVSFESRLPTLFSAADLVVARAGAMTVAELAAIGTPSILVPLPGAPGDHQRKNAEQIAKDGGALIIDDADAKPESLYEVIAPLLSDEHRLAAMSSAAYSIGRRDGTERVAALINEVLQASRPVSPALA